MYVDRFVFPGENEEQICREKLYRSSGKLIEDFYPFGLLSGKHLSELDLTSSITILYGGNGSGKSTVLNVIARRLQLNRIAPFNTGMCFDKYVGLCSYEMGFDEDGFQNRLPNGSRIITSDDIFDYMLTLRVGNEQIRDDRAENKRYHDDVSAKRTRGCGPIPKLAGIADYERYRKEVMALDKSVTRKQFIKRMAGT